MIMDCAKYLVGLLVLTGVFLMPSVPGTPFVSEAQPNKVVLAELFTGTWCPFCPGSSGALERLEAELGPENLIILAYHNAAGRSDPYDTPEGAARASFYRIPGYPTVVFNGLYKFAGGDTNPNNLEIDNEYLGRYNDARARPLKMDIMLDGVIRMEDPSRYVADCRVDVTATDRLTGGPAVQFVLYEDDLNYRAPNGETHFDWVVRDMHEPGLLTISEAGEQQTFTRSFLLDPKWDREHLGIVVFVQNGVRPNEIVHAASIEIE